MSHIFDEYRAAYDTLTPAEHSEWYDRIAEEYPEQRYYSPWLVRPLASGRVVEVGGWRGELARDVLFGASVESWTNYEICRWAAMSPVCLDPKYVSVWDPIRFAWEHDEFSGDLLVLSHVLEHLSVRHAEALIGVFPRFGRVYVDAPLLGDVWRGSTTTHVLPWSWDEFLERSGCEAVKLGDTVHEAQAWVLTP